jgi:hypothetical protein
MMALALLAIAGSALQANAQPEQRQPELTTPLEPLTTSITADQIFAQLEIHNELRKSALLGYSVLRTYEVTDTKGKVHAAEVGRMEFRAPDQKRFVPISETGSGVIRRMALKRLISSEIDAATGKERRDSAMSPANYSLTLLGEQQVGPYRCFVAQVVPKRENKYLFEGRIWIDVNDYAVVRIEGHPAKKPSFWVQQADFVRQYQKVGNFWLPQRDETLIRIRLYGKKLLTIQHQDYVVNGMQNPNLERSVPSQEARARGIADGR